MPKRLIILIIFIIACAIVARVNGLGVTTKPKGLEAPVTFIQSSPHTSQLEQPAGSGKLLQPAVMP